jgi:hypothetical protein
VKRWRMAVSSALSTRPKSKSPHDEHLNLASCVSAIDASQVSALSKEENLI